MLSLIFLFACRYCPDEHSLTSEQHQDDTCSLPPPLTVEELMLESSFISSTSSNLSKDKKCFQSSKIGRKKAYSVRNREKMLKMLSDYTKNSINTRETQEKSPNPLSEYSLMSSILKNQQSDINDFDTFVPISEHTLNTVTSADDRSSSPCHKIPVSDSASESGFNFSNSFQLLQPDKRYSSVQLTSSPRRSSSQMTIKKRYCHSLHSNMNNDERPRSSCSYRDFQSKFLPANNRKCAAVIQVQKSVNSSSNSLPSVSGFPSDNQEEISSSQLVAEYDQESEDEALESSPQRVSSKTI